LIALITVVFLVTGAAYGTPASTLGVATFSYLPYAIFNLASPLLTIAMAFAGVRVLREPNAREQAPAR